MARSLRCIVIVTAYNHSTEPWHETILNRERILLAGPTEITAPLAASLDQSRYTATARFESLAYLTEGVQACEPDGVVIALGAQAHADLAICSSVACSQPTVIWTDRDDVRLVEQALSCGAAAYVIGDTLPQRINQILLVAKIRFEQQRGMREALSRAQQALADRKVIDRAKGILMEKRKLSEDQAYHLMRRIAMNHGKRLAEVASAIVTTPAAVQTL